MIFNRDKIIESELSKLKEVKAIVSEEKESILELNEDGKYIVCYDPLDGSSLVDVNLSVGSIFGDISGVTYRRGYYCSGYLYMDQSDLFTKKLVKTQNYYSV